jgi:hypothetical protein
MTAFAPPFSMRLLAGLKANALAVSIEPLERIVGVHLDLADDLELGGAFYSYAPYPLPEAGVVGVRLHLNEIPGLGLINAERPDLQSLLSIEWFGSDVVDLGRLDWQLRQVFDDLYAVAEYTVASDSPAGKASGPPLVHWVQFEASLPRQESALVDTPTLDCGMEFELDETRSEAALEGLAGISDAAQGMRRVDVHQPGGRPRLTLQFDSRSLLALGRCAEVVDSATGGASRVLGYRVSGDLLRNGSLDRIEQTFG